MTPTVLIVDNSLTDSLYNSNRTLVAETVMPALRG